MKSFKTSRIGFSGKHNKALLGRSKCRCKYDIKMYLRKVVVLNKVKHNTILSRIISPTWIRYVFQPAIRPSSGQTNTKCAKQDNIKLKKDCVISSFRREEDENCGLLGCYAASSGNGLPKFGDNLSVPSAENGTHRLPRNVGNELPLLAA